MRTLAFFFATALTPALTLCSAGQQDTWLARVQPVMTSPERQRYLSLSSEDERENFRAAFWTGKAVTADEYFERLSYADAKYGSGDAGSGINTDQGRVYIALGPPTQLAQLPSSRILQPLEIWRYDHIAGLPVSSEIQLLFFRPRGVGIPKLYSPQIHSVRALLINNAGSRGAFPVNDVVTADDLMNRLQLSPAELEAVDAAMSVARGVRGSGNSELLYRLSSPVAMLRRNIREKVESRIYTATERTKITTSPQARSADGIPVVDLTIETTLKSTIGVEIQGVEAFETKLNFEAPTAVSHHHRLYLLPGTWTIVINADGHRTVLPLEVRLLHATDPEAPASFAPTSNAGVIDIAYRVNLTRDAQWVSAGRQYVRSGDLTRASVCFRNALAINEASSHATSGLGRVLALQNRLDEARDYLVKALRMQPGDYESLVLLAGVTARFQDNPQALEYYKQAEAIRPSGEVQMAIRELRLRDRAAMRE